MTEPYQPNPYAPHDKNQEALAAAQARGEVQVPAPPNPVGAPTGDKSKQGGAERA